jgi:cytochrome d ubiquinol oxidase subunit I
MMDILLPFLILGVVLLIHLVFVNINIGLGLFSYLLRIKSIYNDELESVARKAFKFLAATEIISGLFGTIITVVLAGLWPTLFNIAMIILYIPILVSLVGIMLRMTSIVGFWYTWGASRTKIHLIIGFIMVVSGFMIPGGFRYIFAFIDKPVGLISMSPITGDPIVAFNNPIYPPLLLHTWIGALSIGLLTLATGFAWASKYDDSLTKWGAYAALWGALLIIPQGIIGFWFWNILSVESPYLFKSIMGPLSSPMGGHTNVFPTFIFMILSGIYLLIAGIVFYKAPYRLNVGYTLGPVSILSLLFGEFTHDYGRLPYMVLSGDGGLKAELFVNKLLILSIGDILIIFIPIIIMLLIFLGFLYMYLVKGFLT